LGWQYNTDRLEEDGIIDSYFVGPIKGVNTKVDESQFPPQYLTVLQNVDSYLERVPGYSLLDTTMDALDDAAPQAFGQRRGSDGTDAFVIIQDDGVVARWDASGNAWVQLAEGIGASGQWWSVLQEIDYLIFSNPTYGNWKYDGTNFLPLGAKIINNAEATTDWAVAGDLLNLATSTTNKFGVNALTADALLLDEEGTFIYDPTTLNANTGLLEADDYTEDDRLTFWFRCSDVSTLDTTATLFRIETSTGNDFDVPLSAWTDEDGTVITPVDNTWHRVTHIISSGTEAGTYDHTSLDLFEVTFNTDGTGGCSVFIDQVCMQYKAANTMPGLRATTVWKDVFFGGRDSSNTARIHFAKAGGSDFYSNLAFTDVNAEDGNPITALHRYFNQVFIGKENSIHSLGGSIAGTVYPNYNFEVLDITTEHGVDSHRAVVEADNRLFFPWQNRFFMYDGTNTQEIGEDVINTMGDYEETLLEDKLGAYNRRTKEIWQLWPGNGDTTNTHLVKYDLRTKGFLGPHDDSEALALQWLTVVFDAGRQKLVGIDTAGDIMWVDDFTTPATDFDGTAIVAIIRFPWTSAGKPMERKIWQETLFNFDTESSGSLTIAYRIADHPREMKAASFTTATTLDLTATGNLGWAHIGDSSRWIQLQVTTSAVAFDLALPVHLTCVPLGLWS